MFSRSSLASSSSRSLLRRRFPDFDMNRYFTSRLFTFASSPPWIARMISQSRWVSCMAFTL